MRACVWCGEEVKATDEEAPHSNPHQPVHWECGLRSVVGGINHQNGQCSCCGGTLDPDPKGVPRRIAAQMAANAFMARNWKHFA